MAPKRDLQQSIDAPISKRIGKEIADQVTKKSKEDDLARLHSVAILKDIPESSHRIESSSESEVEDEDEGLDIWEREARRMFPPREETNGWRSWTTQELIIIEMEYMAAMLDVVPVTDEIDDAELGPEVQFDMQYVEEEDIEEVVASEQTTEDATDQKIAGQGIEDSESAKSPQEPKDNDQAAPSEDGAATVDASNAVADPSSSIPPTN